MFEHEGRRFTVTAVVAAARNGVIGADGRMPWTLKGDLKHYRALTMGLPMIMGQRTLVSIGRLLDGRDTIVLTRSGKASVDGALVAGDAEEALRLAAGCALARGRHEIAVTGGAEVYQLLLPWTDEIAMTRIEAEPDGDTLFPRLDPDDWASSAAMPIDRSPGDTADAVFVRLRRRPSAARSQ